jgi:hypothetical protein
MSNTLATTIRCDARRAAELVQFFNSRGVTIDSMSDLLRQTVNTLSAIAISNDLAEGVSTTEDAIQILRANGVIDMTQHRKNRNFQTLVETLETEDLILGDKETTTINKFEPTDDMRKDLARREKELVDEKGGLGSIPNVVEDE